jgi:hypothetical protein
MSGAAQKKAVHLAVVRAEAGVRLATVVARQEHGWIVRTGGAETFAVASAAVDPALLEEAMQTGARVVVDGDPPEIVGALATGRSVGIDRNGDVAADVRRFRVKAREDVTLKTAHGFLQLKGGEAELYAERIVLRARELARFLARMIKLN